jgi:hypothetical protein
VKYKVRTLFDITSTGVTGHFKSSRAKFATQDTWDRARNQQRNYETLTQLISLRTNISDVTLPVEIDGYWEFEFDTETESNFGDESDPFLVLRQDAGGVPMLTELDNDPDVDPMLITQGARQNIWFELVPINNILEN